VMPPRRSHRYRSSRMSGDPDSLQVIGMIRVNSRSQGRAGRATRTLITTRATAPATSATRRPATTIPRAAASERTRRLIPGRLDRRALWVRWCGREDRPRGPGGSGGRDQCGPAPLGASPGKLCCASSRSSPCQGLEVGLRALPTWCTVQPKSGPTSPPSCSVRCGTSPFLPPDVRSHGLRLQGCCFGQLAMRGQWLPRREAVRVALAGAAFLLVLLG
jgi:hypothetical protein